MASEDEQTMQLTGRAAVEACLASGTLPSVVLIAEDEDLIPLRKRLVSLGVECITATRKDLWRMGRADTPTRVLGLWGRQVPRTMDALMEHPGPAWLLSGVAYPSNVGTIVRCVEVTGACGIVVDGPFNRQARLRAKRVAMGADRLMSVLWAGSVDAIRAARSAGRRVLAIESNGDRFPWEVRFDSNVLFIAGGETEGISEEILSLADEVIKLPCPGFIPSWNVQAAVSSVAYEYLRQVHCVGDV